MNGRLVENGVRINRFVLKRCATVSIAVVFLLGGWLVAVRHFSPALYKNLKDHAEFYGVRVANSELSSKSAGGIAFSRLIAHGGGGIGRYTYTNSLEALNASYGRGLRFIELDFILTEDEHVVLLHDWTASVQRLFKMPPKRYRLDEFRQFDMIGDLHQMDLDDLFHWMRLHPDARIVTDGKSDNLVVLKKIKERFPGSLARFVPQIYFFREYGAVRELGFRNIILTLYRSNYIDDLVVRFVEAYAVGAVTMPKDRGQSLLPERLKRIGVRSFVHTINDAALKNKLVQNDVYSVYTDYLVPDGHRPDAHALEN